MDANVQAETLFMQDNKPRISYFGQFGILIGLVGVGAILAALIQLGILITITDLKTLMSGNSDKLIEVMALPQNTNKVMLMQVLGTLVMMAIPAFAFAKIVAKQPVQYLGFSNSNY